VLAALILIAFDHLPGSAIAGAFVFGFAISLAVLSVAVLPLFILSSARTAAGLPAALLALLLGGLPVTLALEEVGAQYYVLDHQGAHAPPTERLRILGESALTIESAAAAAGAALAALLFWYRLAPGASMRGGTPFRTKGTPNG
jgi:hypothetical protein